MSSTIDLYEAFKDKVGTKAAKMLAESIPQAEQLATKQDISQLEARLMRWMLALFIPMYAALFIHMLK